MPNLNLNLDVISLAGIFGVFIMPAIMIILIVWLVLHHRNKQNNLKAELYAKAIESGQTIPDNLFEKKEKKENKTPLQKGILWTSIGAGIALFFVLVGIADNNCQQLLQGVGIAMIPIFVGIGHLLVHFIGKKQAQENDSDK